MWWRLTPEGEATMIWLVDMGSSKVVFLLYQSFILSVLPLEWIFQATRTHREKLPQRTAPHAMNTATSCLLYQNLNSRPSLLLSLFRKASEACSSLTPHIPRSALSSESKKALTCAIFSRKTRTRKTHCSTHNSASCQRSLKRWKSRTKGRSQHR